MASSSSSSNSRNQLRATLESLQAVDLPDSIKDSFPPPVSDNNNDDDNKKFVGGGGGGVVDPALIQRYKEARDLYLRRHIQSMFLAHIGTYDGHSIQEVPDRPTEDDEEEMQQQLDLLHQQVTESADSLQQQTLELQHKYSTFCLRRDELEKMVHDMDDDDEEEAEKKKTDDTEGDQASNMDATAGSDQENNDDDDEDIEDALAQEEERLVRLQQRKAQLQVQLHKMRQETEQLKLKTEQTEANVAEMLQGRREEEPEQELPSSPTEVQREAAEMQEKLEKLKEIRDFYDGIRGVLEQLNALQILEVTNGDNNNNNKAGGGGGAASEVHIRVRALEKHEIDITLRPDSEKGGGELRVADAKFLTSTIVRAPVEDTAAAAATTVTNASDNDEKNSNSKVLKLTIPPLDDLVKLCAMFPAGEDLRFLARETMARIRLVQARVEELAILHNNVLTKIGTYQQNDDGFGGEEQEVVCSLNECITVVLRLTADCPNVPGSVYISHMVGVAGWDDETVEQIKETVSKQDFQTPWSAIQAIQCEIRRLQDEEGLSLPKTPTLPLRRKKAS